MIKTERCQLTPFYETDLEPLVRLHIEPEVWRYLGGPKDEETIRTRLTKSLGGEPRPYYWAVRDKSDEAFVGMVTLTDHHDGEDTEISYLLLPEWWGRGYASESVQAIINHGLTELGLPRVIAETQTANDASCRLLERLGMILERKVERFDEEQSIYTTI